MEGVGHRNLVMVSSVHLLLLKAWRGSGRRRGRGRSEAWLVAVIISGHHHDVLPLRRGGWGHQLHLRHCVLR
jgi:hypothetical protein